MTKHILKHHKTEQKDYIGTDDIIIKKGKKSVKDPAAIDFLEKSMIVLQQSGVAPNSASPTNNNNELDKQQQQCFFLSLGLDNGSSLDLKADSGSENGEEEEAESDSARASAIRTTRDGSGASSANLSNFFNFKAFLL